MIVRVWNARAIAPKVLQYLARFHDAVLPQLKTLSGFMGATVMQREISVGELEIVVANALAIDAGGAVVCR